MLSTRPHHARALTFVRLLTLFLGGFLLSSCRDTGATGPSAEHLSPTLSTQASQSWVRSSFFFDNTGFVACLGENVRFFGEAPFRYHEVTSGSGNFSFHLQLVPATPNTPPFFAVAQTSGKVYLYKNGGPINETFHLAAGQVHTVIDNETYVADNGDRLTVSLRAHMTVNANGVLTVSRTEFTDFECVNR
jgi:hypothetical protein